ncbi:UNVERIFIED_ORG: hypothetical protein FHR35_003276, partial [Microbispora rosea subsp. rosea]
RADEPLVTAGSPGSGRMPGLAAEVEAALDRVLGRS